MYYIYMIRCTDNSIYTGITTDLQRRMKEHKTKDKNCAKYTLLHSFEKIEKVWCSEKRNHACKLEYHIKRLPKKQKEELILKEIYNIKYLCGKIDLDNYSRYKIKEFDIEIEGSN